LQSSKISANLELSIDGVIAACLVQYCKHVTRLMHYCAARGKAIIWLFTINWLTGCINKKQTNKNQCHLVWGEIISVLFARGQQFATAWHIYTPCLKKTEKKIVFVPSSSNVNQIWQFLAHR